MPKSREKWAGLTRDELEKVVRERTEQLDLANRELERELASRIRFEQELSARAEDLKRSNAELEQFAYAVSHDLQEPLRAITTNCQTLERRYGATLGAEGVESLQFATAGARRLQALIQGLLDFSRVSRNDPTLEWVDLNVILAEAKANLKTLIDETHAELRVGQLPRIHGRRPRLAQLFQNLIANAIKFRGKEAPRIEIGVAAEAGAWHFTVKDNGIGIEPRHFDRIFVIFQRLHTQDEYPGTGIGLAICKKIVERHGGKIWIESAPGRGSTFHFTIPQAGEGERKIAA